MTGLKKIGVGNNEVSSVEDGLELILSLGTSQIKNIKNLSKA